MALRPAAPARGAMTHINSNLSEVSNFSDTSLLSQEILTKYERSSNLRTTATKLIGTIGPACNDVATLSNMLRAGMTVARFDLSCFTLDYHVKAYHTLSEAMRQTGVLCATMVDTKGPEIQVVRETRVDEQGDVRITSAPLEFVTGATVTLTSDTTQACTSSVLPVTYSRIHQVVEPGDRIILTRYLITGADLGSVTLDVQAVNGRDVVCRCTSTATLVGALNIFFKNAKGRPVRTDLPTISQEDQDLVAAFYRGTGSLDFLCVAGSECAADLAMARKLCDGIGAGDARVFAKIETLFALEHFDEINEAADGIVLSRGRLGQDVPVEKFPRVQKHIIGECNSQGKPIWITRVVDTMSEAPRPTRAEATDVANAVLDGADGIMLGAETLRGQHPTIAVETVLQIAREAEAYFVRTGAADEHFQHLAEGMRGIAKGSFQKMSSVEACASSVVRASAKLGAAAIVCFASTGTTARLISKWRPHVPIIAVIQPRLKAANGLRWKFSGLTLAKQLLACRGVIPTLSAAVIGPFGAGDEGLAQMRGGGTAAPLRDALQNGLDLGLFELGANDHVVVTAKMGNDHTIKVVNVDEMMGDRPKRTESTASYATLLDKPSPKADRRASMHPTASVFANALPSASYASVTVAPAPAAPAPIEEEALPPPPADVASRLMRGETAEAAAHDYLRDLERRLENTNVSGHPVSGKKHRRS